MLPEYPVKSIKITDLGYPPGLISLSTPPNPLYYMGALPDNSLKIGIVGSRKMSAYGGQALAEIIPGLAGLDICIISGLAFGVDAEAHRLALENGLNTAAVLGSAIDKIEPNINRPLAMNILTAGGTIISEYAPGEITYKTSFPHRNRIIAGLCQAVIVIEADYGSGALITAKSARSLKRKVFAVPGSIFQPLCNGTNKLLKEGATPLTNAKDLLRHFANNALGTNNVLRITYSEGRREDLSENERKVYGLVGKEPVEYQKILEQSGLPIEQLNISLSMLEIKNKIIKSENGCYRKNLTTNRNLG